MSLPNFMCIGAAKSGTTTLYDILRQHPDVFIPAFKEPHFFDIPANYKNGIAWYERTYFKSVKNEKCIADFTPSYFFEANTAKRIYNDLGEDVKFIVILRNPVDRAYSHYLHSLRDEREELIFSDAIEIEKQRLSNYKKNNDVLNYLRHSYISQSMYGSMLQFYLKDFPIENFLIIHFEKEFIAQRKQTIKKVLNFLDLDDEVELKIDLKSNPASKARSKTIKRMMQKTGWWRTILKIILPSQIRQIMKNRIQRANISSFTPEPIQEEERKRIFLNYFSDDIKMLEKLLNKKMNW